MYFSITLVLIQLLVLRMYHSIASYPQAFTINTFTLPDGTVLFHDLFISSDKTIIFVSAPGFGQFKNSAFLKSMKATVLYTSLGARQHDTKIDLTVNIILDEVTPDGEVKVVSELTHSDLEMIITTFHHLTLEVSFLNTTRAFFLKTELPLWYRSKYDVVVFTMIKTEHTNQIRSFVEHYRSLGAGHIVVYFNGKFADFPKTMEFVFGLWETGEPVTFVEWNYEFWKISDQLGYKVHYAQVMALHSAFYRMRGVCKWFGHFDLDEYLVFDNTEGNKDLVNGHYYTLTERMDDYDYEKVGVVRFRMSSAYIITPGFDITDFKLWKVYSSSFIRELNMTNSRSKYFANTALTKRVNVHTGAGGGQFLDSGYYFLHFSFEHPMKSAREMKTPSVQISFSTLMSKESLILHQHHEQHNNELSKTVRKGDPPILPGKRVDAKTLGKITEKNLKVQKLVEDDDDLGEIITEDQEFRSKKEVVIDYGAVKNEKKMNPISVKAPEELERVEDELSKLDFNGSAEDEAQQSKQQETASEEKQQEHRVQEHEKEQQLEFDELQRVEDELSKLDFGDIIEEGDAHRKLQHRTRRSHMTLRNL